MRENRQLTYRTPRPKGKLAVLWVGSYLVMTLVYLIIGISVGYDPAELVTGMLYVCTMLYILFAIIPLATITLTIFHRSKKIQAEIQTETELKIDEPADVSVTLRSNSGLKAVVIHFLADFADLDTPSTNLGRLSKGQSRATGVRLIPKRRGPHVLGVDLEEEGTMLEIIDGLFPTVSVK